MKTVINEQEQLDMFMDNNNFAKNVGIVVLKSVFFFLFLFSVAAAKDPISKANTTFQKGAIEFGLAYGELVYTAFSSNKPSESPSNKIDASLDALTLSYHSKFDLQRAGANLTGKTLDWVITTSSAAGGPPSILTGAIVNWGKNKALTALKGEIDKESKIYLAANLGKFSKEAGLDYDTLHNSNDPEEIKEAINKNGLILDFKPKFVNDEIGKEAITNSIVRNIIEADKATLDIIADQRNDIETSKKNIEDIGYALSDYAKKISTALTGIDDRVSNVEGAINDANDALSDLQKKVTGNSKELRLVGDVLYSKASTSEKLSMLKAGWNSELSNETRGNLRRYLEGEQKKEIFLGEMRDLVNTIGSIGAVAKNIGIKSDELNLAAKYASGINQTLNAAISGNYLGAIVSATGMFGAQQPDAETVRHQQLMNYLDQEFKEINGKLDTLIENQEKIVQAIAKLSNQIEEFRGEMHTRLDMIDFKLDTIIGLTYSLFSAPAGNCQVQKKLIEDEFNQEYSKGNKMFGTLDLTKFSQLEEIPKLRLSNNDLGDCISFLHRVFVVASTEPSNLISTPLAARYAKEPPRSSFPIKDDVAVDKGYDSNNSVRSFLESHYKPTFNWIVSRKSIENKQFSEAAMFAIFASPSPDLRSYQKKIGELLVDNFESCSRYTKLSEPAYQLLCSDKDKEALLENAPKHAQKTKEARAARLVLSWLHSPLMQEPLAELSQLALFFSPISDIQKPDNSLYQTRDEFLNSPVKPRAPRILIPAMKTTTLAIAQVNMLHGDFTSGLLFEALWNKAEERFLTREEIDRADTGQDDRKLARMMIEKNPFLARNVLMMALNRTIVASYKNPSLLYVIAFEHMREMDIDPTSLLDILFANKVKFQNEFEPILETDSAVDCRKLNGNQLNDTQLVTKCYRIPKAQVVDVSVPLPTPDEFTRRTLIYPPIMYELIAARDQIANRLAHYTMLNSLPTSGEADKLEAVRNLVTSSQVP
jgi:hypothetical protein